jgi:hypothetical protein
MSAVAALLSITLFLGFVLAGAQKLLFDPVMSKSAEHLGFTKRNYQRIGIVEMTGAIGIVVGVVAHRGSFLGIVNELAATGLAVMMALAVRAHLRRGDGAKMFSPALALGLLALVELIFRLS